MAMENGGLSASDALLLGSGNGGFGGNSFMWIFGLLILMGMFNGGFGWGNGNAALGYENLSTSNEVQRGFDNQNTMANQREILSSVNAGTAQAVAATNQSFHDNLTVMQNLYNETSRDIADLRVGQANAFSAQKDCCNDTKMLIQQTSADTNANLTSQIQSVKDMIAQNKIEALQGQVNQLQLQQATAGVLRFPNQWSYGAGPFPPIFGGCCGSNNI